jgi:phosphatidylglycerophosphate synthase
VGRRSRSPLRPAATGPAAPAHPGDGRDEALRLAADLLGCLRLALAIAFPAAIARGGWSAVLVFTAAAVSDYADGPLARRGGRPSAYGTLLDNVADIAFVLVGTTTAAASGAIGWIVPAAIACSATAYAVASLTRTCTTGTPVRAYSAIGHAAGVCNYALVGLYAGSVALPGDLWTPTLAVGAAVVVALNLGAVGLRWLPGFRARAWRA